MKGLLLLAAFTIHVLVILAQEVYHVDPTNDTWCSGLPQPCLTLNQYVEKADEYFSPGAVDVVMQFFPGAHCLCGALSVTDLESVTMIGKSDPLIYCSPSCGGGIEFNNVSHVVIAGLNVVSCGIANESITLPALLLFEVSNAVLKNTRFKSNKNAGALWIFYSNATFIGNTSFTDNEDYEAGAIYGVSSDLAFIGTQVFENNSAIDGCGGAIVLSSFSISFSGETVFRHNRAENEGGAVYIDEGTFEVTGYLSIMYNHAEYGGAVSMYNSSVAVNGCSSFRDNSALHEGGAVYINEGTFEVTGYLRVTYNHAKYGGAVSMYNSSVEVNGCSSFMYNSECGAVYIDEGTFGVTGYLSIMYNHAEYGGAVVMDKSSFSVNGCSSFMYNSALHAGGVFFAVTSNLQLDGNRNTNLGESLIYAPVQPLLFRTIWPVEAEER